MENKKVFIITGAGHFPGVGSSTALKLLQEGNCVIVNARNFDDAWQKHIDNYPNFIACVPGDISKSDTQQELVDKAIKLWGRIDGLINNASTGKAEFVDEKITPACWHENFEVNVIAVYEFSELCRRWLTLSNGSIVNISTRSGLQPGVGNNIAYAISKAALNHLTKQQAMSFAPNVTVNAVCPGFIGSQRLQNIFGDSYQEKSQKFSSQVLIQELIDPDKIADTVIHLLGARQITGQLIPICGGSTIQPKF